MQTTRNHSLNFHSTCKIEMINERDVKLRVTRWGDNIDIRWRKKRKRWRTRTRTRIRRCWKHDANEAMEHQHWRVGRKACTDLKIEKSTEPRFYKNSNKNTLRCRYSRSTVELELGPPPSSGRAAAVPVPPRRESGRAPGTP